MNSMFTSDGPNFKKGIYISFFIILSAIILFVNWHVINGLHMEDGDFAANSILIQKAKNFDLFVGNYSRVGFNHPGPAILYVLAAGEALFFDTLHWVQSPFSGQLLIIVFYSAFWATLILRAFFRATKSFPLSFLALSCFLMLAAAANYRFFDGPWFPDLYFFPYAVMLICVARVIEGETDSLVPLALSAGFLINGHASFIPMLGIIFILALSINVLMYRKAEPARCLVSKAFWSRNRGILLFSIFVFFLFFVPLGIETVIHFPGPLGQYAGFGTMHHTNDLVPAIGFVAQYWLGVPEFLAAFTVMVAGLLYGFVRGVQPRDRVIHAINAALLAATLAVIFYAKYGVDDFSLGYIALFSYAIPLTFICMVIFLVYRWLPFVVFKSVAAAILGVLFLAATSFYIARVPASPYAYDLPAIADVYAGLKKIENGDRVVLLLTKNVDLLVGAKAYALRKNESLFCLGTGWFIMYADEARCTPQELAESPRMQVLDVTAAKPPARPEDFNAGDLAFRLISLSPPDLSDGKPLTAASSPQEFGRVLYGNWSEVDGPYVWQLSSEVHLKFGIGTGHSGVLRLHLAAFLPKSDSRQSAELQIKGKTVATLTFTPSHNDQYVDIPIPAQASDTINMTVVNHSLLSPKASGMSMDDRSLGVSLYGLQFLQQ